MRTAFARALMDLAMTDESIFLAVGDVGFGVFEDFATRYPRRYLNVGVAEQNLAGVSAGLALSGATVFMYSIANFPTLRCLEQIRLDICYNRANVKICAVGAGFAYGALGSTHHATEDLAIMRSLPDMVVVSPCDPVEADLATRAAAAHRGPVYLRIGRSGDPVLHERRLDDFAFGKASRLRAGAHATIIVTGGIASVAVEAARLLANDHIEVGVISMHTLKPLDTESVKSALLGGPVLTLEEHSIVGGLGSAVAEVVAEAGSHYGFRRLALPDAFCHLVGSRDYLLERFDLTPVTVADAMRGLLAHKMPSPAAHN